MVEVRVGGVVVPVAPGSFDCAAAPLRGAATPLRMTELSAANHFAQEDRLVSVYNLVEWPNHLHILMRHAGTGFRCGLR